MSPTAPDGHGGDAATEQALASAFTAMRAVGRREADRLRVEQVDRIAAAAAAVARAAAAPAADPTDTPSPVGPLLLTADEPLDEGVDGVELAVVSSLPSPSHRSRTRSRLGLVVVAAAVLAIAMATLRPDAEQVSVSIADQPDGPVGQPDPSSATSWSTPATAAPTTAPDVPSSTTSAAVPAEAGQAEAGQAETSGQVVAGTDTGAPDPAAVDPPPVETSTSAPPASPATSPSTAPTSAVGQGQPSAETMVLTVGDAGTVTVAMVESEPVLVDVAPASGWTPSVVQDHSSLLVQFTTPGDVGLLHIWADAGSFGLLIDPGSTGSGGYTRTRTIDLTPGGAVMVTHTGGELRSIDAVASPGWVLQSATTGPDQLDLGFVAGGNWQPAGYVLTVGGLEIVIRAGG